MGSQRLDPVQHCYPARRIVEFGHSDRKDVSLLLLKAMARPLGPLVDAKNLSHWKDAKEVPEMEACRSRPTSEQRMADMAGRAQQGSI